MAQRKKQIFAVLGWLLLITGLLLYVVPLLYDAIGHNSGLLAFILIFVGISILKKRKDQINQNDQINK